ncbi:MAG: hypothetical protein R6X06_12480 [Gammaproteobacteria bacterium]
MAKVIGLNLPSRRKPTRDDVDIRLKNIEQWIDDLPKANVGETARRVFELLVASNQINYAPLLRYKFLEAMRGQVQYVTEALRKHFVGVSFPLPAKSQKIAAITRELYLELATGYKIALEDSLAKSMFFIDKKLATQLCHRAMNALSHSLLTSYQTYAPYPNHLWLELHQLYDFADRYKLLRTSVRDEQHRYVEKSSIYTEYVRTLLLALTSPYRLRHGEAGKVYDTLERWTMHTSIHPFNDKNVHKGHFGFNLDADKPPRSLALAADNCEHAACRILNTEPLAHIIRDEILNTADVGATTLTSIDMQRPDLSHDLLRRLLIAWGVISKRNFPRSSKYEKVRVTIGLSATHKIITDGRKSRRNNMSRHKGPLDDIYSSTAHYDSSVIESVNDTQPDVWDMIYPNDTTQFERQKQQERQALKQAPPTPVAGAEAEPYAVETWAILNESASGYCLQCENESDAKIQVGELIGIRRSGDGHTWKWGIGVIRWMRINEDQRLLLGIEMLTPDAAAIGIKPAVSDGLDEYKRTLMLPELRAINQPPTLITGPVPYRVGNKLMINILGKRVNVQLTKLLQNTGLFAQFQFEIQSDQDKANVGNVSDWSMDRDFGNIWSSI